MALCYYFSDPQLGEPDVADEAEPDVRDEYEDAIRAVSVRSRVRVTADLDAPPADAADAYLRLHLLSHRLVRPNSVNLDGIFKILPNVCWTSLGPVEVREIGAVRLSELRIGKVIAERRPVPPHRGNRVSPRPLSHGARLPQHDRPPAADGT